MHSIKKKPIVIVIYVIKNDIIYFRLKHLHGILKMSNVLLCIDFFRYIVLNMIIYNDFFAY